MGAFAPADIFNLVALDFASTSLAISQSSRCILSPGIVTGPRLWL